LIFQENPGKKRQEFLKKIEEEIKKSQSLGSDICVMSLATNVYTPSPVTFLGYHIMGHIEEQLVKFRQDGCRNVLILLSTYGGEITFPEALVSKIREMDFENAYTFILDVAFSAGTLLALLSNKIIGFPNAHVGPVDPQMIVAGPQGITSVIGAMTVKRLIEEVLPQLAIQQGIGKEGLTRLYAAQDLYLYEKALESIKYIEDIFSDKICKTVKRCEELKKLLLHGATEHSQPISLRQLAEIIPEKVMLIDDSPSQPLPELVISYRALLRYLFNFESRPGVAPGTIKLFVIGSKYGEIIGEALPFPTQVPPTRPPPPLQEKPQQK
jgi:hypothetical protein